MRVRPWLSVVVRNACMDEHRRRLPQPVADAPDSAVEDQDPFGSDPYLDQAWEALPARFRTVLHHRELLGLSYDEIATAMGVSRSAVQTLLFRARGALRREYQRAGGELLGCGAFGLALLSLGDGEPVRHGHQLAGHLASCGACRSAVDRLAELSDLMRLGARAMDAPLHPPSAACPSVAGRP
ncbi:MAG: RNA polymerase sigma factor [Mycobacteriales bacterium]|nr:RNA polymerase sigma factor [Mycobacteriales bacterium]